MLCFLLASCSMDIKDSEPKVTEISIYSTGKIEYLSGEDFNVSDYSVFIKYSDGETEIIPLTKEMVNKSALDMSVPEEKKKVTITYGGVSTELFIKVNQLVFDKIELTSVPNKTTYVEGESVDTDGAVISIFYEGGSKVSINVTHEMLDSYSNAVGVRNITMHYFGEVLKFAVEFIPKTVISIDILRPPKQVNVFKNYGDNLSRDNMKIRLRYDNGVTEEFENSIMSADSNAEQVAANRNKWASQIESNLKIYIKDDEVDSAVAAKVSYIQSDVTNEIEYNFNGTCRVAVGQVVDNTTVIATTSYLEDVISKSEGIVTAAEEGKVTVSRFIQYQCNKTVYQVGDIVNNEEIIGTYSGTNVKAEISGQVVEKTSGSITLRALPTSTFVIGVIDRSFAKMEILSTPTTKKDGNSVYNIIQGDTLDLSTGMVKVIYDNGESENFRMDNGHISLVKTSTNLKKEIEGLTFTGIEDKKNIIVGGAYELQYGYTLEDTDMEQYLNTTVSIVDNLGNVYVNGNRYFNPENNKVYTVSITVTYYNTVTQEKKVSEASYSIATGDAIPDKGRLDISEAGLHTLHILYDGMEDQYAEMQVTVVQKVPTEIIVDANTNNITNYNFYIGDELPFNSIRYKIRYSNEEVDADWTPVGKDMVISTSDFVERKNEAYICADVGTEQSITIALKENSAITFVFIFNIVPYQISNIKITKQPDDKFLSAKGNSNGIIGSSLIDLTGAVFSVSYSNGKNMILEDYSYESLSLNALLSNGINGLLPLLRIAFDDNDFEEKTIEQIYDKPEPYKATLTFTDKYGQSYTLNEVDGLMEYFIVDRKPDSIKVTTNVYHDQQQIKTDYIQCEDWDFTNLELFVTYQNGTGYDSETVPLRKEMVFDSTTNEIGQNFKLYIRYLGVKEETPTLSYNVSERKETGITMVKRGKADYLATDGELDLSEYLFRLSYNAGTSKEIVGITAFDGGEMKMGWWYEIFDAEIKDGDEKPSPSYNYNGEMIESNMRTIGYKMIRLHHTNALEALDGNNKQYSDVFTDFYIEITYNGTGINHIAFEDTDKFADNVPVLGVFATGMPLIYTHYDENTDTLRTRLLTIYYENGQKAYIKMTDDMVSISYMVNDKTPGYRMVTVDFGGMECNFKADMRNAELTAIELTTVPTTNYISGDEISIDGGILKAVYKDEQGNEFYNYVLLSNNTPFLEFSQIKSEIPVYKDGEYLKFQTETITITYGPENNKITTTYEIRIYNKLDLEFRYGNVIFFYGNTKEAIATPIQDISEFVLPDNIVLKYVSDEFFVTKDFYDSLSASEKTYYIEIIVKLDKNSSESTVMYVRKNNIMDTRPYTPARGDARYYILMQVGGNHYYRSRNYCYQEYLIIRKVIEVNVLNYTERAFVFRFETDNNPAAIDYLYNNIANINNSYMAQYNFITNIILASPNQKYFEVIVNLNSDYTDTDLPSVEAIYNGIQAQIQAKCNILKFAKTKGVNTMQYSGQQPEYISYTIAKGETLKLGGILELLNGNLELDKYVTGLSSVTNNNGTLYHNNYTVDLVNDNAYYLISPCEVDENGIEILGLDENTNELTIGKDDEITLLVKASGEQAQRADNGYPIAYYTDESRSENSKIDGFPTEAGRYYARLTEGYYIYGENALKAGQPYELDFVLILQP